MEPWLGGKKPKALSFSAYNSKQYKYDYRTRDVDKNQKIDILGLSLGLNQRLKWPDDYFMLSTSINYQRYTLKNYYFPLFKFDNNNGKTNNLSFAVNFSRNSHDSPIYPRRGSKFNLGLKFTPPYSLFEKDKDYDNMSNNDKFKWLEFYKTSFSGQWFNEISNDLVLLTGAEIGILGAYNDDLGISPFERFYVGGDGLQGQNYDGRQTIGLRGYPNSSLTTGGGGTVYNKFSLELRYPITLKPSASIYVLGFLEGGNSFDKMKEFDPFLLKRSAGLGLRLFMPSFGLLGIDFAHGFDDIPNNPGVKSGWQTHFTIGQQF